MREFEVTRMGLHSNHLYTENLIFADGEKADDWAENVNASKTHAQVINIEEVHDYDHSELKYEY